MQAERAEPEGKKELLLEAEQKCASWLRVKREKQGIGRQMRSVGGPLAGFLPFRALFRLREESGGDQRSL